MSSTKNQSWFQKKTNSNIYYHSGLCFSAALVAVFSLILDRFNFNHYD